MGGLVSKYVIFVCNIILVMHKTILVIIIIIIILCQVGGLVSKYVIFVCNTMHKTIFVLYYYANS